MVKRDFRLDEEEIHCLLATAQRSASEFNLENLIRRAESGNGLQLSELAVLWFSSLDTEQIYSLALSVCDKCEEPLESFSPLYMTNTCDAECKMCGMRRDNGALQR